MLGSVDLRTTDEASNLADLDSDFFAYFPHQCIDDEFSGFNQATGKYPVRPAFTLLLHQHNSIVATQYADGNMINADSV
jgi:hypothetical protein